MGVTDEQGVDGMASAGNRQVLPFRVPSGLLTVVGVVGDVTFLLLGSGPVV